MIRTMPETPKRGEPILAYPEGLHVCPVCGIGFVPAPTRADQVYCSGPCRQRAYRGRAS
jgi:hypothetical protein